MKRRIGVASSQSHACLRPKQLMSPAPPYIAVVKSAAFAAGPLQATHTHRRWPRYAQEGSNPTRIAWPHHLIEKRRVTPRAKGDAGTLVADGRREASRQTVVSTGWRQYEEVEEKAASVGGSRHPRRPPTPSAGGARGWRCRERGCAGGRPSVLPCGSVLHSTACQRAECDYSEHTRGWQF